MTALTNRQTSTFNFKPFSVRQKKILSWWTDASPYKDYNGIIADGSIRSGKTLSMSLSFVTWGMEAFNEMNFAMCGKTISALRRNVINDLKRMLTSRGYIVKDRRSDNLLIVYRGDVVNYFYMFGGNDESSQDLIQGITLAGVYFDEVALMPESFVNQATGRCSVEGAKFWFNCNPSHRLHWFKQNWINKYQKKKLLYLHFTMDDNLTLSPAKKAMYHAMYVGVFFRRYIEGLWVAAEGLIYDMWNDDENTFLLDDIKDKKFASHRRYIAIDYGTTNPMVFLDARDDGKTYWLVNEYYYNSRKVGDDKNWKQKTDVEYADDFEAFVEKDHSVTVIVDPSALSFRLELRNRGYRVMAADNEVLDGIRMTGSFIQRRRVKVEKENCPNTLKERESYVWDEKAQMRGIEQPVKENDHAMDALRYLIKTTCTRRRMVA